MTTTKHGPSWLQFKDDKWMEIPEAVATVRRIFDMAMKGLGPDNIAVHLDKADIPTIGRRCGALQVWDANMVDKLLKSVAVIGLSEDAAGNETACYPDIISYVDWIFVQTIRGLRSSGRKGSVANLFSNRIYCGKCESVPRFRPATDHDKVPYLACPGCGAGRIDYQQLELWVLMCLERQKLQEVRPVQGLLREQEEGQPVRPMAELVVRLFKERDNKEFRLLVQLGIAQVVERIEVTENNVTVRCRNGRVSVVDVQITRPVSEAKISPISASK